MKNILLFVFAISAFTATSNAAALECKGKNKDSQVSMTLLDLANRKVIEGQINPVGIRIVEVVKSVEGSEVEAILFAGVVNALTEDVQLFLNSKDKKSLSGTIYMDELYDVTITVKGRAIRFTCEL